MAKKFTKLILGDVVKTVGGKSFRKLNTATTPTIITFTLQGGTYQAEEGMTWADWVNSEYNTGGYYIEGIGIYTYYNSRVYYQPYQAANITIYGSDIILANGTYDTRQTTSGGAGN